MKILILSDNFPPQSCGGAERAAFNLAPGFKKAGHDPYIITTVRERRNEKISDYNGLKVFEIYANYHQRWRGYLGLYNPQTVGRVEKIMREIKPDVVHAHNIHYYLSYHCLKLAKKHSKALFLTAHDVMLFNFGKLATQKYLEQFNYQTNWWDHLKQAQKRYNPFCNIVISSYLKYVDKIFAVSDALKKALNQNNIQNVEVIYNGIEADDWRASSGLIEEFKRKHNLQDKKIILFGGRVSGFKGKGQIDQAMSKIKKEIPGAVLLVMGSDAAQAGELRPVGRGVGWLQGDGLKAAYHASDVVVVPSVYLDPFPNINLEAMASAKPVVATRYGGSSEIVQDGITGFIANPFNINELSEKIIDLLKNEEKAEQFGQAGLERVKKHFNLDSQVAQTIAWYQRFVC